LLRGKPAGNETNSIWKDAYRSFPPPATTFRLSAPTKLMESVRAMPKTGMTFEVDVFRMPAKIGKKGERPVWPYCLLVVDSRSYFILGMELLTVKTILENMWAEVPEKVLSIINKNGMRPKTIKTKKPWVYLVNDAPCKELGIRLELSPHLEALEDAQRHLEEFSNKKLG